MSGFKVGHFCFYKVDDFLNIRMLTIGRWFSRCAILYKIIEEYRRSASGAGRCVATPRLGRAAPTPAPRRVRMCKAHPSRTGSPSSNWRSRRSAIRPRSCKVVLPIEIATVESIFSSIIGCLGRRFPHIGACGRLGFSGFAFVIHQRYFERNIFFRDSHDKIFNLKN